MIAMRHDVSRIFALSPHDAILRQSAFRLASPVGQEESTVALSRLALALRRKHHRRVYALVGSAMSGFTTATALVLAICGLLLEYGQASNWGCGRLKLYQLKAAVPLQEEMGVQLPALAV